MAKTEPVPGEPPGAPLAVSRLRREERRDAAYRAAWEEIDGLAPGEAVQYHEGNLGADVAKDPEIAGRADARNGWCVLVPNIFWRSGGA